MTKPARPTTPLFRARPSASIASIASITSIARLAVGVATAGLLAVSCGKREPPDTMEPAPASSSANAPSTANRAPVLAAAPGGEWNSAQIDWQPYDAGMKRARDQKKPVCLIVSASWCPHCKNYSHVFDDPRVVERARDFVMIHIDSDAQPEIAEKNAVDGGYIPRTFFLDSNGTIAKSIHPQRPRYQYFYDEREPGSLLDGMATALRTLTSG